jgi:hypothetical protein
LVAAAPATKELKQALAPLRKATSQANFIVSKLKIQKINLKQIK